jgi:dTMP kinase
LAVTDVERLSRWATDELTPDVTVLLDLDPAVGLARSSGPADRLEAEPLAFHQRVREQFLALAAREPGRYLIVDAKAPPARVHDPVRVCIGDELR